MARTIINVARRPGNREVSPAKSTSGETLSATGVAPGVAPFAAWLVPIVRCRSETGTEPVARTCIDAPAGTTIWVPSAKLPDKPLPLATTVPDSIESICVESPPAESS